LARILVMAFSELHRDPRVDRQIRFLRDQHEVVTAGFTASAYPDLEFHPIEWEVQPFARAITRQILSVPRAASGRFERLHWAVPMHAASRAAVAGLDADLVLVNDVPGLPAAFEAARGAPVILDSHEHAPTEFGERRTWRFLGGPYAVWLLKTYGPRLAAMTTVSRGIADAYEAEFGWTVDVVTNAPFRSDLEPQPATDPLRLIHHGIAAERRRLELLIEAVAPLGARLTLDLMLAPGSPSYIRRLERLAEPLRHVSIHDPVPYDELVSTVNRYDVGVHLIPPGTTHDYYALPNKVFEFIQGRVALAVSPSPEMRNLVDEFKLGVVSDEPSAIAFRAALAGLDRENVMAFKRASHRAADVLNAENNRKLLLAIVERALGSGAETVSR
jgi:hypothetical protein